MLVHPALHTYYWFVGMSRGDRIDVLFVWEREFDRDILGVGYIGVLDAFYYWVFDWLLFQMEERTLAYVLLWVFRRSNLNHCVIDHIGVGHASSSIDNKKIRKC